MFDLVRTSLLKMAVNIDSDEADIDAAISIEQEINKLRNQLRKEQIESLKNNKYDHSTGIVFNDLIGQCEKIGDLAINISEAISR